MNEEIRAFVAVLISQDLQRTIASVQEEFKKISSEVKWVAMENFHVTLKFLGSIRGNELDGIAKSLTEALSGVEPFDVEIGGVGAFPSVGRPRTVWVGSTSGQKEFSELAGRVDEALEKVGFTRENKPFAAHITIGRLKDDRGAGELAAALRDSQVGRIGTIRVTSIALMKSELRRDGPIYTMLSEIPLQKGDMETDTDG